MTENALHLPILSPLSEHSNTNVPFVIVGDEGFALDDCLLRPNGGAHLDRVKRIFNYRLNRARRYVECAFGILSNKLRIFHIPLDLHIETAICVVKACTVLHNFVRQKDGFDFESTQTEQEINCFPNIILSAQSRRGGSSANSIRATFADYFVSEVGSVPRQDETIGF